MSAPLWFKAPFKLLHPFLLEKLRNRVGGRGVGGRGVGLKGEWEVKRGLWLGGWRGELG